MEHQSQEDAERWEAELDVPLPGQKSDTFDDMAQFDGLIDQP